MVMSSIVLSGKEEVCSGSVGGHIVIVGKAALRTHKDWGRQVFSV